MVDLVDEDLGGLRRAALRREVTAVCPVADDGAARATKGQRGGGKGAARVPVSIAAGNPTFSGAMTANYISGNLTI